MIQGLRALQKDYENHLEALKNEKKGLKKANARVDGIAKKNAEIGILVDTDEIKIGNEIRLEEVEKEIVKVKKVIHRLGKCINIMLEGQIDTEHSDNLTYEERIALEIEGNNKLVEQYCNEE